MKVLLTEVLWCTRMWHQSLAWIRLNPTWSGGRGRLCAPASGMPRYPWSDAGPASGWPSPPTHWNKGNNSHKLLRSSFNHMGKCIYSHDCPSVFAFALPSHRAGTRRYKENVNNHVFFSPQKVMHNDYPGVQVSLVAQEWWSKMVGRYGQQQIYSIDSDLSCGIEQFHRWGCP